MSRHPLRRLLAILFAVAFFSASASQVMPILAQPMGAGMTMAAHDGNSDSPPMPCKGTTPTCIVDPGCIFMIGVPVPASRAAVLLTWSPVSYQSPAATIEDGRIRAPDLRPPIHLI
ncbi:MAG: hypothetical protein EXR07_05300 [Acetobacteraceae bacterium]|nr:hypothetical protein [Acetobacteraceae bacterium]